MFDKRLYELLPHRPPMLLINEVVEVAADKSSAVVFVDEQVPFYVKGCGVPAWVGVEYMGQTAALMAGFQLQQGLVEPHLGVLLGTRRYQAYQPYFQDGLSLLIECSEVALVGDNLATFDCRISSQSSTETLAEGKLSVFRKPLEEQA